MDLAAAVHIHTIKEAPQNRQFLGAVLGRHGNGGSGNYSNSACCHYARPIDELGGSNRVFLRPFREKKKSQYPQISPVLARIGLCETVSGMLAGISRWKCQLR